MFVDNADTAAESIKGKATYRVQTVFSERGSRIYIWQDGEKKYWHYVSPVHLVDWTQPEEK